MAQQGSDNSGDDLRSLKAKVLDAYHDEDDKDLPHKTELDKIFRILEANNGRITSQPPVLEKKDAEELGKLLREINVVLRQRKAWWEQQQQQQQQSTSPAAKSKKKKVMPSVSDCNPFKSRAPEQQGGTSPPASVEPLLQRTIAILGDAPPAAAAAEVTTEFYEWTTSYIDETRIYGWDDDATKVAVALVGGGEDDEDKDGEEILFRAAGIVGIHGSGKTALAQKVFVHDKIKDAFPLRLWVCVGPPDHEDRPGLLYRMLDNLGVDTYKVEAIVDDADVVKKAAAAGSSVDDSKIGVLLYILHVTLHRTGQPYLIVFDDIRAYNRGDDWYRNLTLLPPRAADAEWHDRLAYGLPKTRKSAVLVTCRSEDDARAMVRTGRVFRPPELDADNGWKLFQREYSAAKEAMEAKVAKVEEEEEAKKEEEDELYKELEKMKKEIVEKCLGLPVAVIEAARGFAMVPPSDLAFAKAEAEEKEKKEKEKAKAEAEEKEKAKAAAGETAPPPPTTTTTNSSSTEEPAAAAAHDQPSSAAAKEK